MKLFIALFTIATGTEFEMYISSNNLINAQAEAQRYANEHGVHLADVTAF